MSQGSIPRERSLGEMMPLFVRENVIKVEVADDLFHYCKHGTLGVSAGKGHAEMEFIATETNYNSKLRSIVVISDVWKPVELISAIDKSTTLFRSRGRSAFSNNLLQ